MVRAGFVRDVEDNYEALVLHDELSGDTIEFQRSLVHDAQDVALGMDTYAIVRNGGAAHYGGLAAFTVVDGVLHLDLDPDAAAVLELPCRTEIILDADAASAVEERLPRIVRCAP